MSAAEVVSSSQRRGSGPPNSEILGSSICEYPPTLNDIGYPDPPKIINSIYNVLNKAHVPQEPLALDISGILAELLWLYQLDDRLPPPTAEEHPVYLITAAKSHPRRSYGHWSYYSQGHCFHLTAPRSNKKQFEEAKCETKSISSPAGSITLGLKVQNLVNANEADFVLPTRKTQETALQAYHVGHTRFNIQQVNRLAAFVISTMKTYNFFERNCQVFIISLLYRTIMSQRDCSIFVGDIHQIADWDMRGRHLGDRTYSRATGYLLVQPRATLPDWQLSTHFTYRWPFILWTGIRISRRTKRIATLYHDGELALSAFDPSGQREGIRLALHRFHHDMNPSTPKGLIHGPLQAEFWEDLKQRRWHAVLFGRPERRKASYIASEIKARNGRAGAQILLSLHRWCLQVTKEERRLWREEAAAVAMTAVPA